MQLLWHNAMMYIQWVVVRKQPRESSYSGQELGLDNLRLFYLSWYIQR